MEISAEKTSLMTNSANGIQRYIKVKGQKLGTVTSFKYLGAVVSDDSSKPEILSRIAQTAAALSKLKPIWRIKTSLGSKVKLIRSLVISIFLYACESLTLIAETCVLGCKEAWTYSVKPPQPQGDQSTILHELYVSVYADDPVISGLYISLADIDQPWSSVCVCFGSLCTFYSLRIAFCPYQSARVCCMYTYAKPIKNSPTLFLHVAERYQ